MWRHPIPTPTPNPNPSPTPTPPPTPTQPRPNPHPHTHIHMYTPSRTPQPQPHPNPNPNPNPTKHTHTHTPPIPTQTTPPPHNRGSPLTPTRDLINLSTVMDALIIMTSSNGNISASLAICAGNSPAIGHKGKWRGALKFSLICAWINGSVNNREAGDLRRHRVHYDCNVWVFCISVAGHTGATGSTGPAGHTGATGKNMMTSWHDHVMIWLRHISIPYYLIQLQWVKAGSTMWSLRVFLSKLWANSIIAGDLKHSVAHVTSLQCSFIGTGTIAQLP